MRPINLIPPEDRRGEHAQLRTGPTAYVLLGVLALALLTVTMLVTTGNKINDRNAELAALESQEATAAQTAEALSPYVEFATMSAARDQTISSLAQSRFDWERVLRELSLVIPDDVWLITATGSVSAEAANAAAGGGTGLRSGTTGPALELIGCASSQQAVAGFVASLEDIDGVTRVGISASELGESSGGGDSAGASEDCRTRKFISRFEIVAAFDAVPAAGAAAPAAGGAAPAATSADPATADTVATEQAAADSVAAQTQQAGNAASVVTGGSP